MQATDFLCYYFIIILKYNLKSLFWRQLLILTEVKGVTCSVNFCMANFYDYVIFLGWEKCVSQCKVTTFVNSKIEKINYTVRMLKKPKKKSCFFFFWLQRD